MNDRQYYTVKIPNPKSSIQKTLDVSIGNNRTQRYSLDENTVMIKTNPQRIAAQEAKGIPFDIMFPPGLTTVLTHEEAKALGQTAEWQNEAP
jgi:hypothetical protein